MATVSRIIKFTPTIGGNDKLPDDEKFHVELRAVDVGKKQSQLRKFVEMDPKKLMKEMMSESQANEVRKMLNDHFIGFINFTFKEIATEEHEATRLEAYIVERDDVTGEEKERSDEKRAVKAGDRYIRAMTIGDIFDIGEFELAMEIFMHMIGSSQLRRTPLPKTDAGGNLIPPTAGEDQEDEEKNSESLSGSTVTH